MLDSSVKRSYRRTAVVGATVAAVIAGGGLALAGSGPRTDKQITNMTTEVANIKAYYGDTVDAHGEHWPSAQSNYAAQVAGIERKAAKYLAAKADKPGHGKKKAIVLDVDDTTLSTYNYELETTFVYSPASNAQYIATKTMPAVFGMNQLVQKAQAEGYTVFYITGRPESQRTYTAANLSAVGYPAATTANLFMKNAANPPAYLPCGATCTTDQYKSDTRAHIESLGYDIVANLGDQYSDLSYGHADKTYKIPNPMYFLP